MSAQLLILISPSQGAPSAALPGSTLIPPDWAVIGLVLAILGSFLLANAILFRHPRHMVRERFGHQQTQLRTIREYIFHRVQVSLGFTCLLSGFGLQLFGRYRPIPIKTEPVFPVVWVSLVSVVVIALLVAGWWWSLWVFRRYVRKYFQGNPPDFEADMEMTREVGELFGITSSGDDTVHSYVERVRTRVGAPRPKVGLTGAEVARDSDDLESKNSAGRLV